MSYYSGWIIQRPENSLDSKLNEKIAIRFNDARSVEWGYSEMMVWQTIYPEIDSDLVKLILKELRNKRTLDAWFNSKILNLNPRIIAELVAMELGG